MVARRKLLIALRRSSVCSAFPSFGQPQTKIWRISILFATSRQSQTGRIGAFMHELHERGDDERKSIVNDWHFADGKYERIPSLATELLRQIMCLIVAVGGPAAGAAHAVRP